MSRRRRLGEECERKWPELRNMLACYFHEDRDVLYGSIEHAMDTAIAEAPIVYRQRARLQLQDALASAEDDTGLRVILQDGLGVNLIFRPAVEARRFAERFEKSLLDSIERHYANLRKPEWKRK